MGTIVEEWVEEQARLTKPDKVYWMQGTEEEMRKLVDVGIREEKIGDHHTFRVPQRERLPQLLPPLEPPDRRGENRAPDLCMPPEKGGCGAEQQLDGAGGGTFDASPPL